MEKSCNETKKKKSLNSHLVPRVISSVAICMFVCVWCAVIIVSTRAEMNYVLYSDGFTRE